MPDIDANAVIAALRQQNAELSWRLALAEAQLSQQTEEPTDGDT